MSERNRFNILDPLRLLAALCVLGYHYSIYLEGYADLSIINALSFGYLGVNFFFMLSGFVITASALNRSAMEFAISRAARLYPAFWACLLFTIIILFVFGNEWIGLGRVAANATILNDYLGIENIDGVYWTLQAEIKFYGCVFLLLLFGVFKYTKVWLSLWMLLTATYYFFEQPFFLSWFINPGYSPYFIGGVCAYLLYQNKKDVFFIVLLAISSIFSVLQAYEKIHQFYPSATQVDALIAGSVVLLFYIFFFLLSFGLFNVRRYAYFPLMGAVSYPLYLIHNRAGKAIIEELLPYINVYLVLLIVTLALVGMSVFIVRFIEKGLSLHITASAEKLIDQIRLISRKPS